MPPGSALVLSSSRGVPKGLSLGSRVGKPEQVFQNLSRMSSSLNVLTVAEDMQRLERTERMMVRLMCGVTLRDRKRSEELLSRLDIEGISEVVRVVDVVD